MSKDNPLEATVFSLIIKLDEFGTLYVDKAYIEDKQLYKYIKDDITPELVEIINYMQEATVVIDHELNRIVNRYRK